MDRVTRRPMLATTALSAALHAVALALVLAQRAPAPEGTRHIAVEIAWEAGDGSGAASGAALPSEPQATAQSSAQAVSGPASESADSPPSMSPSGLTRGPIVPAEPWIAGSSPGDDAEKKMDELRETSPSATAASPEKPAPIEDARGEIKVGADLRSAPTRSRRSDEQLASARPSSPAFSRKREKEPEPQRLEPCPACGRGQGEGGAACAVAEESRVTSRHVSANDVSGSGSVTAAADGGDTADATASAAPGAALAATGDVVSRVPPVYPLTARRRGLQGTAMVRAHFDAQGRPQKVAVVTSSGSAALDNAARDAVTRWRFRAGTAGVLDMPITFRLEGRARGTAAAAAGPDPADRAGRGFHHD